MTRLDPLDPRAGVVMAPMKEPEYTASSLWYRGHRYDERRGIPMWTPCHLCGAEMRPGAVMPECPKAVKVPLSEVPDAPRPRDDDRVVDLLTKILGELQEIRTLTKQLVERGRG